MAAALRPGQRGQGRRAGRARGAAGLPARLRPTPRTRPTWPATPSCGAPPPWPPRPARRWPAPASASTTSPTSTCTRASPARCASPSTRSGIGEDDPGRAVTQTGGLPYHGGPGSNYMTHSLAAMVETLRARPRLLRRDERRRHAHAEARLRRVVDRPRRRRRWPTPHPPPPPPSRSPSSSRPRARPPWRPTRCCTAATAGPSGPLLICDLPGGGRCYALLDGGAARAGRGRGRRADRAHRHPDAGRRDQPRRARLARRRSGPSSPASTAAAAAGSSSPSPCDGHEAVDVARRRRSPSARGRTIDAGTLAAAAIDIPIGLAARRDPGGPTSRRGRRLGPRRSSVFPAPARSVLAATTYEEACALSRAACGKAISKQLFNILPKIREVDALDHARGGSADSFEMSPGAEPGRPGRCADGAPQDARAAGRAERTRRPRPRSSATTRSNAHPTARRAARGVDDVLDAFAGAWTAGASPPASTCSSAATWTRVACAWRSWPERRAPSPHAGPG